MAVTENMLIDIQVKVGNSSKNVDQVSGNLADLNKSISETNQSLKSIERQFQQLGLAFNNVATNITTSNSEVKESFKTLDTEVAKSQRTWDAVLDTTKFAGFIAATGAVAYQFNQVKSAAQPAIDAFQTMAKHAGTAGKIISKSLPTTIWGIAEAAGMAAPALIALGSAMQTTDSIVLDTIGTFLKFAGILAGGVVAAIGFVINLVGNLAVSLGEKLLKSVSANTEAFIKFQSVMSQFNFTIQGFGKTFGEDVVGSLDYWNKTLEDVYKNTVFTRDEIAKSIKILVAEGQVIGLTVEENTKLLNRAADVAAATGRDLYEVTQMIVSGLTNNSQAVLALGIDIRDTSVSHTDYAKTAGISIEQMDSQQLAMARLSTLYERTIPIIGAATKQTETIAGATAIYEKTLKDIEIKLGETGAATEAYYVTLTKIAKFFAELPTPLLAFIGNIKDVAGVLLILVGNILKVSVFAFALIGTMKILNHILSVTLGFTVSLGAAFSYFIRVIAPTVAVFFAVKQALDELYDTNVAFASTIQTMSQSLGIFKIQLFSIKKETNIFTDSLTKAWEFTVTTIKLAITGIMQSINLLALGMQKLKKIFTKDQETIDYYDYTIQELEMRLAGLNDGANKSWKVFDKLGSSTAMAAEKAQEYNQKVEQSTPMAEKFRTKVIQLAKVINEGFDVGVERQKFLGTEFEKAIASYTQAQKELDNVFKTKSSEKDTAQKYADAEKKSIQASLEIEKLRLDTVKKINEQQRTLNLEMLRSQGKNIAAINLEKNEQLKQIDEQIAGLKLLGDVRKDELKILEETRKLIEKTSGMKVSEERSKSLQKAIDAEKLLADIKKESSKVEGNVIQDLVARVEARQSEINKVKETLQATNDYGKRAKKALEEAADVAMNIFDVGLAKLQKEQFDELKKSRESLADSINKEAMTSREYINYQYQRELDILNAKEQQLKAQGLLNSGMTEQFEETRKLLKQQKTSAEKKAPGEDYERMEKAGTGIASSITGVFQTGAMGMVGGAMSIVSAIVDVVDKILDFIPNMINKIAGVFDKATALPDMILNAVKNFGRAITSFTKDFLPNLLKALPEIIDSITETISESIPDATQKLFDQLPELIDKLWARIPDMIEKSVATLVDNSPKIAVMVINAIIKLLPKLIYMYVKLLVVVLPKAIVNGIINGLKNIGNIFKGLSIKGPNIKKMTEGLKLGMKSASKTLTGEASKLFAVMDLGATEKAKSVLENIPGDIEKGAKKAVDYLTMWWRKLLIELQAVWDGIVSIWRKVWDTIKDIWDGLVEAMRNVFAFLKSIWDMVIAALTKLWANLKEVWDHVIAALSSVWAEITKIFSALWDRVLQIWDGIVTAFNQSIQFLKDTWDMVIMALSALWETLKSIWTTVGDALGKVWDKLSSLGTAIWDGLVSAFKSGANLFSDLGSAIWEGLKSGLGSLGTLLKDAFDKLNPSNIFEKIFKIDYKGKGTVENTLGIDIPYANFAKGGMVPGNPLVSGDSVLNDRILALLSPGEAVIPRSLMDNPAIKTLINAVLTGKITPPAFWGGSISIGGKKLIEVGDKGVSVAGQSIIPGPGLVWEQVKTQVMDMVLKMFEANKFHSGGLVPSFAGGGEVPAMLNPGEFVMNRSATNGFGLNLLNQMNQGKGQISQPNITLNIQIETTQPIDETFFRNNLMPRIKDDLKRRTLNGEFIISSKGVRQ